MEQRRVAEGEGPPRDEEGVGACVQVKRVVLEGDLVEN